MLPQFLDAIERSGKNDYERARNLGIPRKTLAEWRKGNIPRILSLIGERPVLSEALCRDYTTPAK